MNRLIAVTTSAVFATAALSELAEEAGEPPEPALLAWIGILLCVIASATFSGLTIGIFSLGREELVLGKRLKDARAARILALRKDSNRLLCTLLWGNVAVNTILAQLMSQVLVGDIWWMSVVIVLVPTALITLFGEILPAALFTRYALTIGSKLAPVVVVLGYVLFVLAAPSGKLLDFLVGPEGLQMHSERQLRAWLQMHGETSGTDISLMEARLAIRALDLDDRPLSDFGQEVDEKSVVRLPSETTLSGQDLTDFLSAVNASRRPWVVLVDEDDQLMKLLDADALFREAYQSRDKLDFSQFCYQPLMVADSKAKLGDIVGKLVVHAKHQKDHVVDKDVILYWNGDKRIITGADILGYLLHGNVERIELTASRVENLEKKGEATSVAAV